MREWPSGFGEAVKVVAVTGRGVGCRLLGCCLGFVAVVLGLRAGLAAGWELLDWAWWQEARIYLTLVEGE